MHFLLIANNRPSLKWINSHELMYAKNSGAMFLTFTPKSKKITYEHWYKKILHVEYHMKGIKSVLYYISETTIGFISFNGALILIFE